MQVGEQDGKRIWENQKTAVPNRELKARVEAYKSRDRESARGKLEQLTAQVAEKLSPNTDRPRARAAGMEKCSERHSHSLFIKCLQLTDKSIKALPVICFVRTEDTGEVFLTVERYPGKLPAVVV